MLLHRSTFSKGHCPQQIRTINIIIINNNNKGITTPPGSNSSGAGVPGATAQLISVGVDSAGEIVAAGALEPFHIFLWSLQTVRRKGGEWIVGCVRKVKVMFKKQGSYKSPYARKFVLALV